MQSKYGLFSLVLLLTERILPSHTQAYHRFIETVLERDVNIPMWPSWYALPRTLHIASASPVHSCLVRSVHCEMCMRKSPSSSNVLLIKGSYSSKCRALVQA